MTKTEPATLTTCPPRFGTLPNLEARHRLPHFRALAAGMGIRLMAWQELVLRVASEMADDGTPSYQSVVVIVPRQCGKSTLGAIMVLERMLLHEKQPQLVAFTAQNLIEGITYWGSQPLEKMKKGGLLDSVGLRLYASTSNPKLQAESTGSVMRILAPHAKSAGHAQTYGMAMVDEAWSFGDSSVENGLLPTMRTIPDPMYAITSTVGTDSSTYLRDKCDKGRAGLVSGKPTQTAYFEWSAPADADIDDTEVWRKAIPAWGHTVSIDTMRREREISTENDFRRMALNQWVEATDDSAIPRGAWLEAQGENVVLDGNIFLAIDAPPERNRSVIVACDEMGRVELATWQAGTDWIPSWLRQACRKNPITGIAYAKGGPLGGLEPELESSNLPLRPLDSQQFCHASGDFVEGLTSGKIRIRPSRIFNIATAGTMKFPRGDRWRIGRRDPSCDVSPICGAAMAYFISQRESFTAPPKAAIRDLEDYITATK